MEKEQTLKDAQALIRAEGRAVENAADQIGESFLEALHLIAGCQKNILVAAVGTSGMIARRFAHLLAACGSRAFYFHPGEALHGPSAAVGSGDLVVALSKAGKSAELNAFLVIARQRGAKIVGITANPHSELARSSDLVIEFQIDPAAEGEGVLPFGSTLVQAAITDAFCLLTRRSRGFDLEEMKTTHPSGATAELVGGSDPTSAQTSSRAGEPGQ